MSQTITQLLRGGLTNIDITAAGSTDSISLTTAYSTFSITFAFTGADADPKFILEGSNDNNTWVNIFSIVTDAETGNVTPLRILMTKAFSDTADGIDSVSGENIPFRHFRVTIDPNGATTGTVAAFLNTEVE